ncbi:MAG: hypothetical protein E7662_09010 [Ruminococcaceae bacterium]|nr:hypothetical protein [Oscillospiraceae bacterium]
MKKRILSLLLAAMMASASLLACSDTPETPDDTGTGTDSAAADTSTVTEEVTTQDPTLTDELPTDKKFSNMDFVILGRDYPEGSVAWKIVDIYTAEETGERINDAVYARNLALNERFGIVVKQDLVTDARSEAEKRITAGENSFALIQEALDRQGALIVGGYILEMTPLQYLNFDKAWWDTDGVNGLSIAGKVFTAMGSGQLNAYKATWVSLFNKKLAKDANLPDLYQVVRDGKWTLDKLLEYASATAKDLNGDGKMEWTVDRFGVGIENGISIPLIMGTGTSLTRFNKDGSFELLIDSEEVAKAAEKIWNFYYSDANTILNVEKLSGVTNRWVAYRSQFASDNFGFMLTHLGTPTLIAGEMQSDFGILPFPKVYAEQEEYISAIQYGNMHSLCIPKIAEDPNRTAMLTEAYQMYSHDTVRPAYYDYTLTLRASRDNESAEMLDIIFANRNLDVSLLYNSTTKAETTLTNIAKEPSAFNFASTMAAQKATIKTNLDTVVQAILKAE